jgi:hypothetical protein
MFRSVACNPVRYSQALQRCFKRSRGFPQSRQSPAIWRFCAVFRQRAVLVLRGRCTVPPSRSTERFPSCVIFIA